MSVALVDGEHVIMLEIADPKMKRSDVAITYAFLIKHSERTNWPRINEAIIKRWSVSGLEWIKCEAWKLVRP